MWQEQDRELVGENMQPRDSRDAQDQLRKAMGRDEAVRQEKLQEWDPRHGEGAPEESRGCQGLQRLPQHQGVRTGQESRGRGGQEGL